MNLEIGHPDSVNRIGNLFRAERRREGSAFAILTREADGHRGLVYSKITGQILMYPLEQEAAARAMVEVLRRKDASRHFRIKRVYPLL